jgi:hypothetical protein
MWFLKKMLLAQNTVIGSNSLKNRLILKKAIQSKTIP